jgi:hypothetical protein
MPMSGLESHGGTSLYVLLEGTGGEVADGADAGTRIVKEAEQLFLVAAAP